MTENGFKMALIAEPVKGHQLQIQHEVGTLEEAKVLADEFSGIMRRQTARANLPVVEAKIFTLDAQVRAHEETISLLSEEVKKLEGNSRKNGSGKVYTIDQTNIENYRKSVFENTVKLEQIKIQKELAEVELTRTKADAGVA